MFRNFFKKHTTDKESKSKSESDLSDFYHEAQICLRRSGNADTGHAAQRLVSRRKSDGQVVEEKSLEIDSRYMAGTLINGLGASIIPTVATATPIKKPNCDWAPHIFSKPITKEQYDKGVEEQKQIRDEVEKGEMYYSVAATSVIANVLPEAIESFNDGMESAQNERQFIGMEVEDITGMPVLHGDSLVKPDYKRTVNCVTPVVQVFSKTGIFKTGAHTIAPNTLARVAKENGFEESDNPHYDTGYDQVLRSTPQNPN
ncbi:MAG: hypothetical protein SFW66_09580 [Gammaproteobacteria bacterium]|nr:hypothetical protein [Gammaproteobacteria bacterium]